MSAVGMFERPSEKAEWLEGPGCMPAPTDQNKSRRAPRPLSALCSPAPSLGQATLPSSQPSHVTTRSQLALFVLSDAQGSFSVARSMDYSYCPKPMQMQHKCFYHLCLTQLTTHSCETTALSSQLLRRAHFCASSPVNGVASPVAEQHRYAV